jgi:hypothetical protein
MRILYIFSYANKYSSKQSSYPIRIFFQKNKTIQPMYVPSNEYNRCLISVATLQRFTHRLPMHMYALRFVLATPKNATHSKSVGKCASNAKIGVWIQIYALL